VIVAGSIDRENVAVTVVARDTAAAPEAGVREVTVGGPRLETVKLQV
jgi:hypothetical protein